MVYYNDHDPYCAAWLRNLIAAGHLPTGEVDERSITDIEAGELAEYTQCHFFAGIGGWVHALRLAGWPDARPVWTGSCPCQPFSVAGQRKGTADERHLWPAFRRLIGECMPAIVFGEQVAGGDGRQWLAGVRLDLEALGYAVGAADLCAAGVGAPHIRQRLWWVADANSERIWRRGILGPSESAGANRERASEQLAGCGVAGGLANANNERLEEWREQSASQECSTVERSGNTRGVEHTAGEQVGLSGCARQQRDAAQRMEHTQGNGRQQWRPESDRRGFASGCGERVERMGNADGTGLFPGAQNGIHRREESTRPRNGELERPSCWSDFDIVPCADGKARRIESGTFPLAHGVPCRVGRLRAYGNAIVPQVAAEVIRAML